MKNWTRIMLLIASVGSLWSASPTLAQPGGGGLNRRFETVSPAIGQPLPDITIYDEKGEPFAVRDLKGQYSVIVFGCLT